VHILDIELKLQGDVVRDTRFSSRIFFECLEKKVSFMLTFVTNLMKIK